MKNYFLVLLFIGQYCFAQTDTLPVRDTGSLLAVQVAIDSVQQKPLFLRFDTALYSNHPYFHFKNPVRRIAAVRAWEGKEVFFYSAITLLLFFALVKNNFGRYLQDLFRLFFRTSLKQRQIKEQMMMAPLPSLLLNILFIVSAALFVNFLFRHYGIGTGFKFWELLLYSCLGIMGIYLAKFLTLKICGWLFRMSDATDAYTFIVFTTNKMLGIALLPCIILIAFTTGAINMAAINLSFLLVGSIFFYRFYLSYASLHKQVKINIFHFLLYLLAFEIAPLLLINKLLFRILA